MREINDISVKSAISTALCKFESYWGYREDKKGEIVESVFKELKKKSMTIETKVEKLSRVDDILAHLEDILHGVEGEECTEARKLVLQIIEVL